MISAGIQEATSQAFTYLQTGWAHKGEDAERRTVDMPPRPYHPGPVEYTIDREQRKIIFMSPDDPEYAEALARPGVPGKVLIISHGNESVAGGGLTPRMMAPIVRDSGIWEPGIPIVHDACNIARTDRGFAWGMAQELGVPYTGPTAYSWRLWQVVGGGSVIYETTTGGNWPDLTRPGRWRTFNPEVNPRDRQ